MRVRQPAFGSVVVTEAGCQAIKLLLTEAISSKKRYRIRNLSAESKARNSNIESSPSRRSSEIFKQTDGSRSSVSSNGHILKNFPPLGKLDEPVRIKESQKLKSSFPKGFFIKKPKPALPGHEDLDKLLNFRNELRQGMKIIEKQENERERSRNRKLNHLKLIVQDKYIEDGWDSIECLKQSRHNISDVLFNPNIRWNKQNWS
jgi:hypothetical protein